VFEPVFSVSQERVCVEPDVVVVGVVWHVAGGTHMPVVASRTFGAVQAGAFIQDDPETVPPAGHV